MEARDYRRKGLFEDGIGKGMALSVLVHGVVFLFTLGILRLMPSRKIDPTLCTVVLLSREGLGGGAMEGEEGAMRPGPREMKGVAGPGTAMRPEPEATHAVESTEAVKETVSSVTLPQKVQKPLEKPKPRPRAVSGLPKKPQTVPHAAHAGPTAPRTNSEGPGAPDGTPSTHGGRHGTGDAEGTGPGHSGEGTGSGTMAGTGGDWGPYTVSFGSQDGPRFLNKVLPKYPRLARELGKEALVLLLVTIDEHGRLVDVRVSKRAGSGFDEEALRAVQCSTFTPARRNGRPVACRAELPVHFVLKGPDRN